MMKSTMQKVRPFSSGVAAAPTPSSVVALRASRRPVVVVCTAAMSAPSRLASSTSRLQHGSSTTRLTSAMPGMSAICISPLRAKLLGDAARQRMPPAMSFLGVGAPEALLVAVVALVVFGPKGLADAAKSIGNTLRAFQPTIREVVEVSQDIKGTLEKELGLDEFREAARVKPRPRSIDASDSDMEALTRSTTSAAGFATPQDGTTTTTAAAANLDDDPEIEAKRRASAALAWGSPPAAAAAAASPASGEAGAHAGGSVPTPNVPSTLTQPPAAAAAAAAAAAGGKGGAPLSTLSMEELEAELARRKAASAASSSSSSQSGVPQA